MTSAPRRYVHGSDLFNGAVKDQNVLKDIGPDHIKVAIVFVIILIRRVPVACRHRQCDIWCMAGPDQQFPTDHLDCLVVPEWLCSRDGRLLPVPQCATSSHRITSSLYRLDTEWHSRSAPHTRAWGRRFTSACSLLLKKPRAVGALCGSRLSNRTACCTSPNWIQTTRSTRRP